MLDWDAKDTLHFVDQTNQMMLSQNASLDPNGDNGKSDAISGAFISYFCYEDERFIEGIKWCWEKRAEINWFRKYILLKKYHYQGFRYPTEHEKLSGLSRDHLTYSLIAFKYSGVSDDFIKTFVTHLRYKISDFAMFTPDLWTWSHAMAGSRFHRFLYYLMEIPTLRAISWWNRFIYKMVPFKSECHQEAWISPIDNKLKPENVKKWSNRLFTIHALHLLAWQIYLLPDSWAKKLLQKMALEITPKHNYVIRMLLGAKVSKQNVMRYQPMFGDRWTGILNPWINDRDLHIVVTDCELVRANCIDVDYVQRLFNKTQNDV